MRGIDTVKKNIQACFQSFYYMGLQNIGSNKKSKKYHDVIDMQIMGHDQAPFTILICHIFTKLPIHSSNCMSS